MKKAEKTHDLVKHAYGAVAREQSSCCGPAKSCCGAKPGSADEGDLGLSCGDPVTFLSLQEGDVVLDLGSGAGKDVFIAARKVGAKGRVIGVDMTPEMLDLARRNAAKFRRSTGLDNVEFRHGQIEALPLEGAAVDVVISNCVINLSPDKPQVFREAFRVLRPGGRLMVSDIVLNRALPKVARDSAALYAACVAGASRREKYLAAIADAGFTSVAVLTDKPYSASTCGPDPVTAEAGAALEGAAASITVSAVKPGPCCAGGRCCR
jgi:SAM-dependent methyltransferase